jgi:type IV pilus assembly protein PilN
LLPYRELRRKAEQSKLNILFGVVFAAALAAALVVHMVLATYISAQTERNEFLKSENSRLDREIEEIKRLQTEIQVLLARKQIIDTLQSNRASAVQILDQMVRTTPSGLYLKSINQTGNKVNAIGYAQNNDLVSAFMQEISKSEFLENPELVEIKASMVGNRRLSEFSVNFSLKRPQAVEKQPAKPKAAAAK